MGRASRGIAVRSRPGDLIRFGFMENLYGRSSVIPSLALSTDGTFEDPARTARLVQLPFGKYFAIRA